MGKLFIVATPIGNLEDITLRALRVLGECDVVLAEDTRTAMKLLQHFDLPHKKLLSFFEENEEERIPGVIALLKEGKNVALISESGTPLISDPGFKLVRQTIKEKLSLESIPGPTALIAALTVSGLPTNAFIFAGFLPKKDVKRKKFLQELEVATKNLKQVKTVVFYESPHRLIKTLQTVKEVFGDVDIVIARELTKLHEEVVRGTVEEMLVYFNKVKPRGEFVTVLKLQ